MQSCPIRVRAREKIKDIFTRIAAGALGGYALTAAFTSFLAIALPFSRPDAVISATLISFAVYAGILLWVFSVDTVSRAWRGLVLATGFFVVFVIISKYLGLP